MRDPHRGIEWPLGLVMPSDTTFEVFLGHTRPRLSLDVSGDLDMTRFALEHMSDPTLYWAQSASFHADNVGDEEALHHFWPLLAEFDLDEDAALAEFDAIRDSLSFMGSPTPFED